VFVSACVLIGPFAPRNISGQECKPLPLDIASIHLQSHKNTCKYLLAMSSYELILNLSRPRVARRGENFSGDPIFGTPLPGQMATNLSTNGGEYE
jgi:hypothetical protein